jgi:hypothetical protein
LRTNVAFIYRTGGEYKAGELKYSIEEFRVHVVKMVKATQLFQRALSAPDDDLIAFANAALSAKL